jgi:hypothetical protein
MQTLGSQEHCEVRLHECQLYLLNRLANLFWASGLEVSVFPSAPITTNYRKFGE